MPLHSTGYQQLQSINHSETQVACARKVPSNPNFYYCNVCYEDKQSYYHFKSEGCLPTVQPHWRRQEHTWGRGSSLSRPVFLAHISLSAGASTFIPPSFLHSLSRNEVPILTRPCFLSVTKMQLICKKSSRVTCLVASSWLGRNLNPQNPLFDLLCGFVKSMRSPK